MQAATEEPFEINLHPELIPYACSEYRSDTASNLHCWFPNLDAVELYAEVCGKVGRLFRLEGFCSSHGDTRYGIPRNTTTVTLEKIVRRYQIRLTLGIDYYTVRSHLYFNMLSHAACRL
jgi:dihydroorotase